MQLCAHPRLDGCIGTRGSWGLVVLCWLGSPGRGNGTHSLLSTSIRATGDWACGGGVVGKPLQVVDWPVAMESHLQRMAFILCWCEAIYDSPHNCCTAYGACHPAHHDSTSPVVSGPCSPHGTLPTHAWGCIHKNTASHSLHYHLTHEHSPGCEHEALHACMYHCMGFCSNRPVQKCNMYSQQGWHAVLWTTMLSASLNHQPGLLPVSVGSVQGDRMTPSPDRQVVWWAVRLASVLSLLLMRHSSPWQMLMVIIGGTSHMLVPVGLEIVLVVIHGCNLWFNNKKYAVCDHCQWNNNYTVVLPKAQAFG